MTVPSLPDLVAEMDRGTHADRARRLAELGRDHAADPALGPLLDALAARSPYEHQLALLAAVVAGDAPRVLAALSDPVVGVRSFAFAHLAQLDVPDDVLSGLLPLSSQADRAKLLRAIVRGRRTALADRLIDEVRRARGDHEAASLLSGCSPDVVARLLPELDHAVSNWSALARRQPDLVLGHVERTLAAASPRRRDRAWNTFGPALAAISRDQPDAVLDLVERHGPAGVIPHALVGELGRLTRHAPGRIAALVLHPAYRERLVNGGPPRGVARNARFLDREAQTQVAVALADDDQLLARFLANIAPSDRAALFEAAYEHVDTTRSVWSTELLDVLPHVVRQAEARRIIALRTIQAHPALVLHHRAALGIAEARPALEAGTRVALAEERGRAYQLLAECTARSRDVDELTVTLATFERLRNEQDPVRALACLGLARVPAVIVDERHAAGIDAVLTAVLEARDTSATTTTALRRWMLALLHAHATDPDGAVFAFALTSLDRLAGPSGTLQLGRLDHILPRGAERPLLATLLPRLRRDAARDHFDLTFALVDALARRADDLDDLQDLLARATRHRRDDVVRQAVVRWLQPPATRSARVEVLVRRDASFLALDPVLRTVATRRQDLLDPLFEKRRVRGRFLSGNARFVPIIQQGTATWLPRQHLAYAAALQQLIDDEGTKGWSVTGAIRVLAQLPGVGLDALAPYLASDDVVRLEAALAALAWTDRPGDALITLLSYAGGDRARVAVYAATRAARFVPAGALGVALAGVLDADDAKITSRKEALRLLGIHRPPGSLDTLLWLGHQDDLHRDLRITIGRSVRAFLDDERAWGVLDRLAAGDADQARSLLETPPDLLARRHRARFGALVVGVTAHPDRLARQSAFSVLAPWAPYAPAAPAAATGCLDDLAGGDAWRTAATALVAMVADGDGADELAAFVAAAARTPDDPEHDAGPERDLPRRQRLTTVVHQLAGLPYEDRSRLRSRLAALAASLDVDATLRPAAVALSIAAIDWADPTDGLRSLVDRVAGRPLVAAGIGGPLGAALHRDRARWGPDACADAVDAILADGAGDAGAALVALAVIEAAGARVGWDDAWRARLRERRADDDVEVATAARSVITTPE